MTWAWIICILSIFWNLKQADRCPQHCTVLFAGKIYINPLARPNWLPNHCVFVTNPTVVLILFLWLIKQTYQVRESVFALFFISWGVVFQGNIVFRIILYKCSAHLGRGAETTSNNLKSNKEHDHHWCQRRCKLYVFSVKKPCFFFFAYVWFGSIRLTNVLETLSLGKDLQVPANI